MTWQRTPTGCILSFGGGPKGSEMVLVSEGAAPAIAVMDAALLQEAQEAIAKVEAPVLGLLLPGHDLSMRRAERRAAEALWRLLTTGALGPRLHQLCGVALGAGEGLRLCLDIGNPGLRAMPWELLGGLSPTEVGVSIEVLRLLPGTRSPGQVPQPQAPGVDILLWTPDSSDPICRRVGARLALALGELPNCRLHILEGLESPPPELSGLTILHIIAHGVGAMDGIVLSGKGSAAFAPDALHAKLRRLMTACHLVYLDVCSGGSNSSRDLEDAPGWQLAMSGGRTVLAPQRPVGTDAAGAMASSFYTGLSQGETVSESLARGRDGVAALGIAHSSCRWWTLCAVVGDVASLDLSPYVSEPSSLPGWVGADAQAEALLHYAHQLALDSGYFGVEHLLLAFLESPVPTPLPSTFKPFLRPLTERTLAFHGGVGGECPSSPRLALIQERIDDKVSLEWLLGELFEVPWVQVALPAGARQALTPRLEQGDGSTWTVDLGDLQSLKDALSSGFRLVVEGGPEDGRELSFTQPGQRLGRFAEGGDKDDGAIVLFEQPYPQDRGMSRSHLVYEGGSRLSLRASGRLLRAGQERILPKGAHTLQIGDGLILGFGTYLRVVSL